MSAQAPTIEFLSSCLMQMGPGGRFALSPDYFAELFPPGHTDEAAFDKGYAFAQERRCAMHFWLGTNEVFFVRLQDTIPGN